MSLAKTLPADIVETILTHLAALFLTGAGGDLAAARRAAAQMLAAYQPGTAEELRLAAQIISFSFHALEALSQASAPDISLSRILRLRGSAVSLNRESDKAQRRLDQLRQARVEAIQAEPEGIAPAPDLTGETGGAPTGNRTRTQTQDERQQDLRIAASLKRAEARIAAHIGSPQVTPVSPIIPCPQVPHTSPFMGAPSNMPCNSVSA